MKKLVEKNGKTFQEAADKNMVLLNKETGEIFAFFPNAKLAKNGENYDIVNREAPEQVLMAGVRAKHFDFIETDMEVAGVLETGFDKKGSEIQKLPEIGGKTVSGIADINEIIASKIAEQFTIGQELQVMRETLMLVIKDLKLDKESYPDFQAYYEYVEGILRESLADKEALFLIQDG